MLCVTKDREPLRCPQREQLCVEALTVEFVERAERLVHQQQVGLQRARAIDTRICTTENSRGTFVAKSEPDERERGGSAPAGTLDAGVSSGNRTLARAPASAGAWNTN
jgi:hypothetical protein